MDRRGMLGLLLGGASSPVIASKKLPQKNTFYGGESLNCRMLGHHEGYGDGAMLIRYKSRGVLNSRCGLILTQDGNTMAWGKALKDFGEMMMRHANHDYSKETI